jgi:hypothetical protein
MKPVTEKHGNQYQIQCFTGNIGKIERSRAEEKKTKQNKAEPEIQSFCNSSSVNFSIETRAAP